MNTELNDKLDLLIAWAARDCENDEAEKFKNIDTTASNIALRTSGIAITVRNPIDMSAISATATRTKHFLHTASAGLSLYLPISLLFRA